MIQTKKQTILIAEDNDDARIMLRTYLEKQGYQVVEAENGCQAVDAAKTEHPDLIMMDLQMPILNGIEAIAEIRKIHELNEVPILANSASGEYGMELFALIGKTELGYIEYLPKPLNFQTLPEQIQTVLLNQDDSA